MSKIFIVSVLLFFTFSGFSRQPDFAAYLFVYFTGNGEGEESIRYAVSKDGRTFTALNANKEIVSADLVSTSGGVRDPHILRSHDGKSFLMTVTDLKVATMGWTNTAIVLLRSGDLINWSSSKVDVTKAYPEFKDVDRVWAPQTVYDATTKKYVVYFSMRTKGDYDKLYYAYVNDTFTALTSPPKQLFFHPQQVSCIDPDIVYDERAGIFRLFFKDSGSTEGIKQATSKNLVSGYQLIDKRMEQTDQKVEGSGLFPMIDGKSWILMYDLFTTGQYQFSESTDLETFNPISGNSKMNFKPRHGSVTPITEEEYERLLERYFVSGELFFNTKSTDVRAGNIAVDQEKKRVDVPLPYRTNMAAVDPGFEAWEATITPSGKQDFSKGDVSYVVKSRHATETFSVHAYHAANPVLNGFYADPDIFYSHNKKKFYLYPTSDGFHGWSGTYFKTFSSDNLIDWVDEGVILDLTKSVPWGNRNAWAPSAIERVIDGKFKYFFYFTAAQKIGVAVSDSPAGPFVDSGKPLIDFKPEGISRGQEIDPMVFNDPATNKNYLYWGNGYLAVAELNEDMISIKRETLKLLTPDETYREGTYVFFRNGIYYFMWSEDDTRSPNYKVRYATSSSPTGPLIISKDNIVIRKSDLLNIQGTGHNSVINMPGTDQWYLVYHRFNYPKGNSMGRAAGYHREVCIDEMKFGTKGEIIEVIPTLKGITR